MFNDVDLDNNSHFFTQNVSARGVIRSYCPTD